MNAPFENPSLPSCSVQDLKFEPSAFTGDGFAWLVKPQMSDATPHLVHANAAAAALVGLQAGEIKAPAFVDLFSGKTPPTNTPQTASIYAGHQFGHFVPQLGDGRAMSYGTLQGSAGTIEVQLKGAGQTPFSRFADGRAVMRSSIREYLCSEAMHALGIPTTRALSIIGTDETVIRETPEQGAVVTRLAPSFIRFGNFEYFAHSDQPEKLKQLADRVITQHFPNLEQNDYAGLFGRIVRSTAEMVAKWQSVGFAHGVMNTDNMSVLGLTIDYGPFGFLDAYDPDFICNHSDHGGRYAFGAQPNVALWNCQALAAAFAGLVESDALHDALRSFAPIYHQAAGTLMARKLGLDDNNSQTLEQNSVLIQELMALMAKSGADFTTTFRLLSTIEGDGPEFFMALFGKNQSEASAWLLEWHKYAQSDVEVRETIMKSVNPKFILRNWVAETAIRAVEDQGDLTMMDRIFACITQPFNDLPASKVSEDLRFAEPPPDFMRDLSVSCSS